MGKATRLQPKSPGAVIVRIDGGHKRRNRKGKRDAKRVHIWPKRAIISPRSVGGVPKKEKERSSVSKGARGLWLNDYVKKKISTSLPPPLPLISRIPSPPQSSRQGRAARWSSSPTSRTPERRYPTARRRRSSCTPTRIHLWHKNDDWLKLRRSYNDCVWNRSYNGRSRATVSMVVLVSQSK